MMAGARSQSVVEDLGRTRQDDLLDAERDAENLPCDEEADDEGGRSDVPAQLLVQWTASLGLALTMSSRRRCVVATNSGS